MPMKRITSRLLILLLTATMTSCLAHPLVLPNLTDSENEDNAALLALLAAGPQTFNVNQIAGFSLDGDATDFLNAAQPDSPQSVLLGADPPGDSTVEPGTDLVGIYMGHDGSHFVFFFQTVAEPSVNVGGMDSSARYFQLQIGGWLIGVDNNDGTAQRFNAYDYFGSDTSCNGINTSDTSLVQSSPAGIYGFEIRVPPSCLGVSDSGSLLTTDRSMSRLDATGDFLTIFFDQLQLPATRISWAFAQY